MLNDRMVKNLLAAAALAVFAAMVLGGCAGLAEMLPGRGGADARGGADDEVAAGSAVPGKRPKLPPFTHGYGREEMVRALVQLNDLRESVDHVSEYLWGDLVFEDYLSSIIWLESEPYLPGQGVTLAFYDEEGNPYHRIRRGWAAGSGEDRYIWKMEHEAPDGQFICEVRTGPEGIPQEVRVKNIESGEIIRRPTFYAQMQPDQPEAANMTEQSYDQTVAWFEKIRREEYQSKITAAYAAMDIVGEEAVLIAGRWVRAVKMSSGSEENRETLVGWFSPDISGKVLKITRGDGSLIAQVVDFEPRLQAELFGR
ncbi:MAG: hypothetical protein ACP5IA_04295 [Sediminispirochaetaceae bacterium]